jgi:hypothetical protein
MLLCACCRVRPCVRRALRSVVLTARCGRCAVRITQDGADGDKKGAKKKGPASKKISGKDQSFFRLVVTGACLHS